MEKNFKEKLEEQEIIKKIENSQTLEKGKQGVFSVLYGRTIVVFLLLLIQILIMIFGVMRLAEAWYAFAVTMTALGVILVIYLINKPENPAYKISWIVMILALPVFGAALYLWRASRPTEEPTQDLWSFTKKCGNFANRIQVSGSTWPRKILRWNGCPSIWPTAAVIRCMKIHPHCISRTGSPNLKR